MGSDSRIQVQLLDAREIAPVTGKFANVYAKLELLQSTQASRTVLDSIKSETCMWTNNPRWNKQFELGPVKEKGLNIRVTLYDRRNRSVFHLMDVKDAQLGYVDVPLKEVLIEDATIEKGASRVAWFPLGESHSGELKLGLRLVNAQHLDSL